MPEQIPLFEIDWGATEINNVVESVTRGGYWAKGPFLDEFEAKLVDYHGVDHAVTFNSGTTALTGALATHGIGPGDEVIVPSFTFIATANAVKLVGADPVFAEIEPKFYGLDPDDVRERITDATVGIIPVHYAGSPCRIRELRDIADKYELTLIEDAAEAQGAKWKDTMIGTIGDAGVLSFCQNKIITTGEGGAVLTDNHQIAEKLRLFRSHGRAGEDYFDAPDSGSYIDLGSNYRMPDIAAALGVAQVGKIEELIARRRAIANRFNDAFANIDLISTPKVPPESRHVYQLYTIRLESVLKRDEFVTKLASRNISSKIYFDPIHLSEYYRSEHGHSAGDLPVTEDVSAQVLSLPIYSTQTLDQTDRIIETVIEAVEAHR